MKTNFEIRGELITLDALLKALGIADSGAQAKMIIAEGYVQVDGKVETRKARKLRGGEVVVLDDIEITLIADPSIK